MNPLSSSRRLAALFSLAIAVLGPTFPLAAQSPVESDYYAITPLETPDGSVIEGGAIVALPDERIAVCTRRGQVWTIENAFSHPEKPARWTLFAEYLHEPLGLAWRDGWLYAVQRPEVTRMKDEDGDGRADVFETYSDDWGISGNYHEYNFGTTFDEAGNLYVTLCLTGSFTSTALYRGWTLQIRPGGETLPWASGIRSPGGIGFNESGDLFYTDNQGAWNGSSSLKWLKEGSFQGNPNGNIWYAHAGEDFGSRPTDPSYAEEGSRIEIAREEIAGFIPPAVVFPHGKVGNSPTGIATDRSSGRFGPFTGQLFVGEQTHSKIHRVFLEKVNGVYQGALFPFLEGFQSGNIGVLLTESGSLFTSGSNRGWGARGGKNFNFERVDWSGQVPFEILEMSATAGGFRLRFTKPVDPETAIDASFAMKAYTYVYRKDYGSPEVDGLEPEVTVAEVAPDGMSLVLSVSPLTKGHVHELHAKGLRSSDGVPLLHPEAYYTLNEIPE